MSKIAITAKGVTDRPRFISRVRSATEMSLEDIVSRLEKQEPLVEYILFNNDHDEIARRLRALLAVEDQGEGELRIFELMPDEQFSEAPLDQTEISASTLKNILDSHDNQRTQLDG
jgi:hypothetical protein